MIPNTSKNLRINCKMNCNSTRTVLRVVTMVHVWWTARTRMSCQNFRLRDKDHVKTKWAASFKSFYKTYRFLVRIKKLNDLEKFNITFKLRKPVHNLMVITRRTMYKPLQLPHFVTHNIEPISHQKKWS